MTWSPLFLTNMTEGGDDVSKKSHHQDEGEQTAQLDKQNGVEPEFNW